MKHLLYLYIIITSISVMGQQKSIKVTNLNKDFSELIKEDFDFISSDIVIDSLDHKFLVFIIVPKHKGLYTITHTFSDIENANTNPTLKDKYGESKNKIKEINYKSKYTIPVYKNPEKQFYKYDGFYYNTNSVIAHNSVNDTIMIPLIMGEYAKHATLKLRKFEDAKGWKDEGSEIMSKENTIAINYENKVESLSLNHFKHHWSTSFHVARDGTMGTSTIYAVFTAMKKGTFTINVEDIEIPIKIISKKTPLKTSYGINCKREQIEENNGGITTTFYKIFTPNTVVLRVGDVIYFKVKETPAKKDEKVNFNTIVFDSKKF